MKECRLCGRMLPVSDYYKLKSERIQAQCRECMQIYMRARRYGLSFAETRDLMASAVCAGCESQVAGRELHIDHCHDTGRIRGVLCANCNTVLTKHMTPEILRRLADYLEASVRQQ